MQVVFAKSVQGASHIRRENEEISHGRKFPCQDKSIAENDLVAADGTKFKFLSVCDGHGGAPYFRSETGADFAIQVVKDILMRNMKRIKELAATKDYEAIKNQLSIAIPKRWREKVENDLMQNPITDQEYLFLGEEKPDVVEKYKDGIDLHSIYGCTSVIYFSTDSFWYALQIGDGDFSISYDGKNFELPMPEDKDCFLNQTTSLCDNHASNEFRYVAGDKLPKFVFCSTDGVANSFKTDEQLKKFYYSIKELFYDDDLINNLKSNQKNPNAIDYVNLRNAVFDEISNYLPILSKKGSGDDISISCLMDYDEKYVQSVKDYFRGYKIYKNGQKKEGKHLLVSSAQCNYPNAWFRLGEIALHESQAMYKITEKVNCLEKAKKCFEASKNLGIPEADNYLLQIENEKQTINQNHNNVQNQIKDAIKPIQVYIEEKFDELNSKVNKFPLDINKVDQESDK